MVVSLAISSDWTVAYLGWSGFHIRNSKNCHVFIDPPKRTSFPKDTAITIFITHGHPEHLGGTIDCIRQGGAELPITVIASETVCRYLSGECRRGAVDLIDVRPGQKQVLLSDIGFEVFQWQHMPLLPPGLGAAARHIFHILRRFPMAWRIIWMSMRGPKGPGEMLGYLLHLPDGKSIIIYGEGLHRHSRAEDVTAIGRKAHDATLMVASEPEDFSELPQLVAASGAARAILYEPHRLWRDIFDLPHADLQALQRAVSAKGIPTKIFEGNG